MTPSHHGPYVLGYTRNTMICTMCRKTARWSKSQKAYLSADCSLQLDCMKLESLVIVDQQATVNTCPGLAHTARQVTRVGGIRSGRPNLLEGSHNDEFGKGD